MFFQTCITLALATAAAAKPIVAAHDIAALPAYSRRGTSVYERDNNRNGNNRNNNNNFNLIDGFQNFNNQDTVVQVQTENLQIQQNGNNVRVVQEKVNQILVVDNQNNGRQRDMNNLFRKSNFRNNNRDKTTVLLVVQEIQVAIDDGRGNQQIQQVFAQSAVVANRGQRQTETVMLFESRTLIQQDIIGNGNNNNNNNNRNGNNNNNNNGVQGIFGAATATAARVQQTADVQLFDQKPTWSSVAEDPAATLGAIWEAELQDQQNVQNNAADNGVNQAAAQQEKASLEAAAKAAEAASTTVAVAESTSAAVAAETAAPAARS